MFSIKKMQRGLKMVWIAPLCLSEQKTKFQRKLFSFCFFAIKGKGVRKRGLQKIEDFFTFLAQAWYPDDNSAGVSTLAPVLPINWPGTCLLSTQFFIWKEAHWRHLKTIFVKQNFQSGQSTPFWALYISLSASTSWGFSDNFLIAANLWDTIALISIDW